MTQGLTEPAGKGVNVSRKFLLCWQRQREPQLKPPPSRSVQQFGMVRGRSDNRVAGQFVDLHEERRNDPLDLTGFVNIASLFANGVKLIKKKYAGRGPGIIKNA